MHLVRQQGLLYGTDFVFTYGPLGWYTTRLAIAVQPWEILLLDIVYVIHVGAILWLALGKRLVWLRYGLVTGLAVLHALAPGLEPPFVFYFFSLAYLGYYQYTGRAWALVGASAFAILTFYMKANVGIVSLSSVVIYAVVQGLGQQMPIRHVGICLGSLALLLGISIMYLPVRLTPYLIAQWHIINSYNDLMYLPPTHFRRALFAALLILFLVLSITLWLLFRLYQSRQLRSFFRQEGALWGLISLQLFILFKESFVRSDADHISLFYKYSLLPLSILALFSAQLLIRRWILLPILLLVVAPNPIPYNWDSTVAYRWARQLITYGRDIMNPKHPPFLPVTSPIPAAWLERIGTKRVDIIPSEVSLAYQYGWHYAPRPVMQTYQVTDGYLDLLNATYYKSADAADYVLMTWNATDGRDPFADETQTKLSLRDHYQLLNQHGNWLLLGRKLKKMRSKQYIVYKQSVQIGQPIPIDTGILQDQFLQVDIRYRPMAQLQRLLFQPPGISVELTHTDNQRDTFRTTTSLLRTGLLVVPRARTLTDMGHFMQNHTELLPQVKTVRLLADTSMVQTTKYALIRVGNTKPALTNNDN
ncbi:hypothetical protein AWR27_05310 [Spirosoma montaniterrae]|uniref:Uncharacterized protein n=1 Tax=Spirosoma montaniterrae TaxID=1178516 RepID=A0A1P9WTU0_9BACT|nr:hypothetical protein AWR27_05310 [Spirosoma montaniterrae]